MSVSVSPIPTLSLINVYIYTLLFVGEQGILAAPLPPSSPFASDIILGVSSKLEF